uniref:Protein regulator of cytokinesis 1 n=1 Tax=Naja naja TaxID=35670 RepID=A0A8C6Y6W1_NAJNA
MFCYLNNLRISTHPSPRRMEYLKRQIYISQDEKWRNMFLKQPSPFLIVDDGLTILQLERAYRLALDSALKEKQERLEKLTQLQREEQALCAELCVAPYYIPTGSIPNSTQLEEVKEHVTNLLKVKEQRLEEFHKLRREIRLYSKEIGHTPDGTLENDMLCDDEEEGYICLTKKYLEDLQQLIHQLQKKKESLMATKDVLMKQVQLLWDRLQWPQENQEQFTKTISQCSICEEKLKEIILKIRQDLESYWQKCFYSDEQKAAFQPFYNEELLHYHDEELVKIKMLYEEDKGLYDTVHKWETILDRFIEFEKKSTDPSRLLNRGGNLLKDERERSKTQKQLSKLGEELKKKVENWEKEHNSNFLIRSQRFLDSMARQLQHYKLKKDQPKTVKIMKTQNGQHACPSFIDWMKIGVKCINIYYLKMTFYVSVSEVGGICNSKRSYEKTCPVEYSNYKQDTQSKILSECLLSNKCSCCLSCACMRYGIKSQEYNIAGSIVKGWS